ncbi:12385_t:CDS:2, partial [Gigaspora margarita]
ICTIPGLLTGAPVGTAMGFTETEYIWKDLFQMYIKHFVNSILLDYPTTELSLLNSKMTFLLTYTSIAIVNAFKTTGIWPLNPKAINSNKLDPSLPTEHIVVSPLSPQNEQIPSDQAFKRRKYKLKNENKNCKSIQKELKPSRIQNMSLKLVLKYPMPQFQQIDSSEPT